MANSLVFIDSRVKDKDFLISLFSSGSTCLVLDADRDGIGQIVSALTGLNGLDSIRIISYGAPGSLLIGSTVLDSSSLDRHALELALIGHALHENGDLLLYGCNVGVGDAGREFVERVSQMTGADVAASDDPTGGAAAGGDWVLEVQSGAVESATELPVLSDYGFVLDNRVPVVSGPLSLSVAEGATTTTLNLLANSSDPDPGDMMRVGPVSYTVNGAPSPLPAGFSQNGNTLAFDPADPEYNSLAEEEQTTIVTTFQVFDSSIDALSFVPAVDYATGAGAWSVANGDLNGDGWLDLMVANQGSDTVSVLLGEGDGTFSPKVDYSTGASPFSVTSGDVDGDGWIDLMVANESSNTVSVLLNQGDGTFAPKVDYATGLAPVSVTSGDVNGDGRLDLMVANEGSNTVSVLLNQGDGTFAPKVDFASGRDPFSVTSGDVNGDGKLDLIVTNRYYFSNTISVLMNQGDGTFSSKVDWLTGYAPFSVTSGDVNGDGFLDLMVANEGSNTVSVLLNDGDGTFAPKVDYETGSDPVSVTTGDMNGDGWLDLMVSNHNGGTVSVLLNHGDGTFAPKIDFDAGRSPGLVAGGDVNGDGLADLMVADYQNGTVSVLFNDSPGNAGYPTTTATITIEGVNDLPVVIAPHVSTLYENGPYYALNLTYNAYDPDGDQLHGAPVSFTVNGEASALPEGVWTGDNLLTIDPSDAAYESLAEGEECSIVATWQVLDSSTDVLSFAGNVEYAAGSGAVSLVNGDVNGDGRLDLMVANSGSNTVSVLLNDGDGTFAPKADYATGTNPSSLMTGDVNRDGWLDLMVANSGSSTVSVLLNEGDGTFASKVDYATGTNPSSVAIGDMNWDGWGDLVVANQGSNTVSVLLNQCNGEFASKVDYATGTNPSSVVIGDMNWDGWGDLVVTNEGSDTVSVLLTQSYGTFAPKVDYATGTNPTSLMIGEMNRDGWGDLIVANKGSDTVSVLMNEGYGVFTPKVDYVVGNTPFAVTGGDLNGDRRTDLIVANRESDTVSALLNHGDGTFAPGVDFATGGSPSSVSVGDVNGDGWLDMMVADSDDHAAAVLISDSSLNSGYPIDTATITIKGINDVPVVSGPLETTLYEGDPFLSLNLLSNAHDVDSGDIMHTGTVSYTVDGAPSGLPAGVTKNGTTLTIDPSDPSYDALAEGEQKTIVATWQVLDSAVIAPVLFVDRVDYEPGEGPGFITDISTGDVNGDGWLDLVVTNAGCNTVSVLINNGDGSFASGVDYDTRSFPVSVTARDVNEDGWLDLIVTYGNSSIENSSAMESVLINNGDGTFAPRVDYDSWHYSSSVTSVDVNRDGFVDQLFADAAIKAISVLISNGDGTFAPKIDYATGNTPHSLMSCDVNGDGWLDLVVVNETTYVSNGDVDQPVVQRWRDKVSVLINNGDGTFAPKVDYETGFISESVNSGDMNGDGFIDLIISDFDSTFSDTSVSFLLNHGDGTFEPILYHEVYPETGDNPEALAIGDVNGDGWLDLMVGIRYGHKLSVLINDSEGNAEYPTTTATITIEGTNDNPTLTVFGGVIVTTQEDTETAITFGMLQASGDEADIDGAVEAFVVRSLMSGTLKIGEDSISATPWNAVTNNTIDATHTAFWTPAQHTIGLLNPFSVVAKDNEEAMSIGQVFLTVQVQESTLIQGTEGQDRLYGTPSDDFIYGYGSLDTLYGYGGNDLLDGGMGIDSMEGGVGNDVYIVDYSGDVVKEYAGAGVDTVQSVITCTLGANVENLTLMGNGAINGKGNALNNIITGNDGANVLNGVTGNDTIDGGGGNDTINGGTGVDVMSGGAGSDRFIFDYLATSESGVVAISHDIITDFVSGQEMLDLSAIDANVNMAGNQVFNSSILSAMNPFTAAGQLRFDGATGMLYGNTNSNLMSAEFTIQLTGVSSLAVGDLVF